MIAEFHDYIGSRHDWLSDLKPYQRGLIERLQDGRDVDQVIEAWFESFRGASNTVHFGTGGGFRPYYDRFLHQLHDLFCSDSSFIEERAEILRQVKAGQSTFATSVALVVAPHLEASAPVLAPAIALVMTVIGKAGLNAWCAEQVARGRGTGNSKPDSG